MRFCAGVLLYKFNPYFHSTKVVPRHEKAVSVFTTVGRGGRVQVCLVAGVTRPEMHLAVVRATFQEAGWDIAVEKVQL